MSHSDRSSQHKPRPGPPLSFLNSRWGRKYAESAERSDPCPAPRRLPRKASRSFSKKTLSSHGCTEPHSGDIRSLHANVDSRDRFAISSTPLTRETSSGSSSVYSQSPGGTPTLFCSPRHESVQFRDQSDGSSTGSDGSSEGEISTTVMFRILQERLNDDILSMLDHDNILSLLDEYTSSSTEDLNVEADELFKPEDGTAARETQANDKHGGFVDLQSKPLPSLPHRHESDDLYPGPSRVSRRAMPADAHEKYRDALALRVPPTDTHPAFRDVARSMDIGAQATQVSKCSQAVPEFLSRKPTTMQFGALPAQEPQRKTAVSSGHLRPATSRGFGSPGSPASDGRYIHVVSRKGKEPLSVSESRVSNSRGVRPEQDIRQSDARAHSSAQTSQTSERRGESSTQHTFSSTRLDRSPSKRQKCNATPAWVSERLSRMQVSPLGSSEHVDRDDNTVPVAASKDLPGGVRETHALPPANRPGQGRRPSRTSSIKKGMSWMVRGSR